MNEVGIQEVLGLFVQRKKTVRRVFVSGNGFFQEFAGSAASNAILDPYVVVGLS